ncbi:MAG: ribose 5-phosphate isomerase B [Thermonemataceae bacterium]|nr:ribose 5-phosphate isomerase B [Thermonemataceae bacterium]
MKIAIGSDHAGFTYKETLQEFLKHKGIEVVNFGTNSSESVDYPDFAHPVAQSVEKKEVDLGILICGSGNGVAMTANKHSEVRAALCWKVELAELARQHNDANILCLPARFVSVEEAQAMVEAFIRTDFEGGRHGNRVNKITCS